MKSSVFWQHEANEIFSVVYQKIEREKLNKMNYFHIMFQCADPELFIKYSHFSHKRCTSFLQYISCHLFILKVPRLNFAYDIQLFFLYKMVIKTSKKFCYQWGQKQLILSIIRYTASRKNDPDRYSMSFIHKNFHLGEIRTSFWIEWHR